MSKNARPYIGGQAVLEGVMMRAPTSFAVVVRRRDGSLHVRERAVSPEPAGFFRLPLARGLASLVESLRLGNEALRFSVEQMERDAAGRSAPSARAALTMRGVLRAAAAFGWTLALLSTRDDASSLSGAPNHKVRAPFSTEARARGFGLGMIAVAIAFFVALPQIAAAALNRGLHFGLPIQSAAFQAMTGAMKLAIVIGYLLAVRKIPEIRRVFQYHGAEHKTISTYEAGEALTVENARAKTTLHPRCGTTFLVMVAIVSVLVFTAVGALLPRIATGNVVLDNALFLLEKLPFLPVLVATTFELQRLFARTCTRGPLRVLLWPGFLVQRITTSEPDDAQLEVALASLKVTLLREDGATELGSSAAAVGLLPAGQEAHFPDFGSLFRAERLVVADPAEGSVHAILRPTDASDRTARSAGPTL